MVHCLNCGVRIVGVLRACPECGSPRMEQYTRPAGCNCGLCMQTETMVVTLCTGAGVQQWQSE